MSDMMTFPDTWEEFEKSYGFTDNEEVYTNGARLIPSFRVKQWLDHLPYVQPEIIRCKDCKSWGRLVTYKDGSTMIDCKRGRSIDPEGYCHLAELREEEHE